MVLDNGSVGENVLQQPFPVGMHVLAVDDNRVCLQTLENLLLKCHYKVTTTTESVKALEMLRENKDRFDLVICDVNMPEMDGFEFLNQVALEMNLPVILLSGHDDAESMMKGVVNGASDYMLKPIRMEDVMTMWQHVVRKKIDGKVLEKKVTFTNNEEKINNIARVCSQDTSCEQNVADKNQVLGQKRKELSKSDNDIDSSTEKKPRFVWNDELRTKFVDAVNQLGLDKAYPRKILELMKVEGITKENIASHLQKFRLSLKKSDKHVRSDSTLDSTNAYLQMGAVDGKRFLNNTLPSYASPSYGSNQLVGGRRFINNTLPSYASPSYGSNQLVGGRRFLNNTLPSYASPSYGSNQLVCRPNAPYGLNSRGMSYVPQPPFQSQNNINCSQMQVVSANERSRFSQDFRTSSETGRFQPNNYLAGNTKLSSIQDPKAFTVSSSFPRFEVAVNNGNSSFLSCTSSNPPLEAFTNHGNRSSLSCTSSNPPLEAFINHSSVGGAVVKTHSLANTLDSVGGEDVKTPSLNNTLNSLPSLAEPNSQPIITQMPEVEKVYSDLITMDSNNRCFFEEMMSLEGLFDSSKGIF